MGPLHSDSLDEFILSWVKNPKKFEKHFIFTLFTTNILVETWTYSVIFQQQKQDIKETVLLTSSFDECFEQPLSTRTLGLVFLEHIFSYVNRTTGTFRFTGASELSPVLLILILRQHDPSNSI